MAAQASQKHYVFFISQTTYQITSLLRMRQEYTFLAGLLPTKRKPLTQLMVLIWLCWPPQPQQFLHLVYQVLSQWSGLEHVSLNYLLDVHHSFYQSIRVEGIRRSAVLEYPKMRRGPTRSAALFLPLVSGRKVVHLIRNLRRHL